MLRQQQIEKKWTQREREREQIIRSWNEKKEAISWESVIGDKVTATLIICLSDSI